MLGELQSHWRLISSVLIGQVICFSMFAIIALPICQLWNLYLLEVFAITGGGGIGLLWDASGHQAV